MTVTIVGVGLIGGSFALALKENNLADHVVGVDNNPSHLQTALKLGLIDEQSSLGEAIKKSTLIVLAIPVDAMTGMLAGLLDKVTNQVVMDMGSTKQKLVELT